VTNGDEMLEIARSRQDDLATPHLTSEPQRKVAILTCMDTRIEVERILGLQRGEANILRNAGGLVTDDAIRSLSISQRVLGTKEIVVMMHEDCGLHGDEEELTEAVAVNGQRPPWPLGAFQDLDQALCEGLDKLRSSEHLAERSLIRGFVYDPTSGRLREPGR
jgi:carbonic anhydrase